MLGTSIDLATARILHHSQKDDVDFEYIKLKAIKAEFLQKIKRVGSFDLYKAYQSKIKEIDTKDKLIAEIKNLGQTLAKKGVDTKKIDLYIAHAVRSLNATQESCIKSYQHLKNDFDLITTKNECRMPEIVKRFDENGIPVPLFKKNEQGVMQTFVDEQGKERYLLNADVLDFSECNKFFKFASKNGFKVHVNPILWHENVPEQIEQLAKSDFPPETKKKMTEDFLYCYMKTYAKNAKEQGVEIESLDILNEVANDDSADFLRRSIWCDLMGDDSWSYEQFESILSNPDYITYTYYYNGILTSFLVAHNLVDSINILLLATAFTFKKRGFATALVKRLIADTKAKNMKIWLEVKKDNLSAISFYDKLGFKKIYERKKYYKDGSSALILEKI